jgi:hypothetical protein
LVDDDDGVQTAAAGVEAKREEAGQTNQGNCGRPDWCLKGPSKTTADR